MSLTVPRPSFSRWSFVVPSLGMYLILCNAYKESVGMSGVLIKMLDICLDARTLYY